MKQWLTNTFWGLASFFRYRTGNEKLVFIALPTIGILYAIDAPNYLLAGMSILAFLRILFHREDNLYD